jgi:hypothetical protein
MFDKYFFGNLQTTNEYRPLANKANLNFVKTKLAQKQTVLFGANCAYVFVPQPQILMIGIT